jgi:hypothetical protein
MADWADGVFASTTVERAAAPDEGRYSVSTRRPLLAW